MNSTQPELFRKRAPAVTQGDVLALMLVLKERGWLTASKLIAEQPGVWTERSLRATAHASEGKIISGQNGYKLTANATSDEIDHCANWLTHQAREMTTRAIQIRRVQLEDAKGNL